MREYRVTWMIDILADDPVEAAQNALGIQRDPDSIATFFTVQPHGEDTDPYNIDLSDPESITTAMENFNG